MQLFNRTPATASITCEFNSNVYNGDTRGVKGRFSLTIPHCLFVAFCTKNGLEDYTKGIILQIFTNTQLSNADRLFTLTYDNEDLTTTSENMTLDETFVNSFTNDMSSVTVCRVALKNDDVTKANATAAEKPLYMYTATMVNRLCGYSSDYNTIPDQTDFKLLVDGVPCICFEATYTYPSGVFNNLCHGHYLTRTNGTGRLNIADYYYTDDCYASWMSAPNYGNNNYNYFCRAQMFWLWVVANGNIDTDFDITDPFQPFPTDFYITVNAYSNHGDNGQQTVDFSWAPQNIEELDIDLSNVLLHFDFFMSGGYDWETSFPYSENGFSTSYKTLLENLDIPWYRNVLNKLPLPSQETNTTISVLIWWSDVTGVAGKCRYEIKYDGTNSITVDKMQDETSGYWTYLTADDTDPNQPYDDDPNPYDDLSDFGGGTDSVNGSALLTTSYALSVSGAHDFGSWLWGTGLDLAQLKMVVNNPIENIVACKLFPFSLTGTESTVKLGNLTSPVNAFLLPENVARTFDMGTITVHRKYNSFLDYAPYTTVRIYLPYLGLHELDTNVVMGQTIRVKYYVDLVTGHCRAIIFLDGNTQKKIQQIDGMIGQDVPVVGSNRAQVEAGYIVGGAQAVANFVGGIGSAIMGNIGSGLSDIGNAVKGGLQTAMQQYHTYTSGTPSPALSRFDEQKICVYVDRPVYTEPDKFKHQNGKMCNLTCKLGTLSGYTVIDNTVDLSSIPCNKEERDELLKLLTSGIYL